MYTKASILFFLILALAGFTFTNNSRMLNDQISIEKESENVFLAVTIPAYCRTQQGVVLETAPRKLKRKIRRKTRSCSVSFSEEGEVRRCVNQFFKRKDGDCDGVNNGRDNCPDDSNSTQDDDDVDDVGNACEAPISSLNAG